MFKKISKWLKKDSTGSNQDDIPRYPPFARGLPVARAERLLEDQKVLITQIQQSVRSTDALFEKYYYPAIVRYARYVHLLPASESHHHRGAGGLLRHGLEVALIAVQLADRVMFALDEVPAERKKIVPRWEYAVFIGALCHDIGKPLSDIEVTNIKGDKSWSPSLMDLVTWAKKNKVDRYYVRWRNERQHKDHEDTSHFVLPKILSDEGTDYLSSSKAGPEPLKAMQRAVTGTISAENKVYEIVLQADRASTEKDLKENPGITNDMGNQYGVPVAQHVCDAMRRLIKSDKWKINRNGARAWFVDNKLYLVWPQASQDITDLLKKDKIPGIPQSPDTIADILFGINYAIPDDVEGGERMRLWLLAPEILNGAKLRVLHFAAPTKIMDMLPVQTPGVVMSCRDQAEDKEDTEPSEKKESSPSSKNTSEVADSKKAENINKNEIKDEVIPPPVKNKVPIKLKEGEPEDRINNPSSIIVHSPQQEIVGPSNEQSSETIKAENSIPVTASKGGVERDSGDKYDAVRPPLTKEQLPEVYEFVSFGGETLQQVDKSEIDNSTGNEQIRENAEMVSGQSSKSVQDSELVQESEDEERIRLIEKFESTGFCSFIPYLAADIRAGEAKKWGIDVLRTDDEIAIAYPSALTSYGISTPDIATELKEKEWIVTDPDNDLRVAVDVDGFKNSKGEEVVKKALVLSEEVSRDFIRLTEIMKKLTYDNEDEIDNKSVKKEEALTDDQIKSEAIAFLRDQTNPGAITDDDGIWFPTKVIKAGVTKRCKSRAPHETWFLILDMQGDGQIREKTIDGVICYGLGKEK